MSVPMKAAFHHSVLTLALTLLLGGCATTGQSPQHQPEGSSTQVEPVSPPEPATVVYGQFSKDSLYALLAAELAGQRNRFDIALNNYLQQAVQTRDAGIIERAMQVSEFLGAQQPALDMALLWTEVAPNDPQALRAAALQLARSGKHEQAMTMMQQVLSLHGETHFDFLALAAMQTDADTRQVLLKNLQELLTRNPGNAQLIFATALLLQQDGREEEALALLEAHPEQSSSTPATIMLQSRLQASQGLPDQAIASLQEGLIAFPDDTRMRLLLARMLLSSGDLNASAAQFDILVQQNPGDTELLLTLGLVNLEGGNPEAAIEQLQQVVEQDPENSTAIYHLGLAYFDAGRSDDAIAAWQQVAAGNEFLSSRLQISRALIDSGDTDTLAAHMRADRAAHPDSALQLYLVEIESLIESHPELAMQRTNQALQAFELDSSLLYTRALLAERLGQPERLEADLRLILEHEPDNAMALNALGYTLADRNERLDEALELIERAYALRPDDPAIADSLGWVHFRLGNLELAEQLLRQAYAAFPDQEVAAHLGEVLWHLDRKQEARSIWREALKDDPDAELIKSTKERLGVR